MSTKPILYNGFPIKDGVTIKSRIERIFFTEVYLLSDNRYLYLFTNIKPDQVMSKPRSYELLTIGHDNNKYLGVISDEHSHEKMTNFIDGLTSLKGLDAVAGMKGLKQMLLNEVIAPLKNPEKYRTFKLSIPNGILLFGPPGCGKTFIVKKLAEELNYNYMELSPSSVGTPYVHGAVGNIAKVFEMAKLSAPSIVFIDEIEGLIPKREELTSSADIKKEEINEFLLQLNNAGENRILVVGATNRPEMIDSAILRSGRMDKRVYVPPPDYEARMEMFRLCLSGRPFDRNIRFYELAKLTDNYVGSDIELIVTQAARMAVAQDKSMIDEPMMIEAIKKCTASISPNEIARYEKFIGLERW